MDKELHHRLLKIEARIRKLEHTIQTMLDEKKTMEMLISINNNLKVDADAEPADNSRASQGKKRSE